MKPKSFFSLIAILLSLLAPAAPALGATAAAPNDPPASRTVSLALDSGRHDGAGDRERKVYEQTIEVEGADWLRLHFGAYDLGQRSYVTITSQKDQGMQRFDAASLPQWYDLSAYFNGPAVRVALYAAPGDRDVFVQIDQARAGSFTSAATATAGQPDTLCGGDNRMAAGNGREGRITELGTNPEGFCTAWLVSNGALLTAGHCADADPDQGGPMLPNGVLDWTTDTVVEFNVPASGPDGVIRLAQPNDQYPIDLDSVVWRFDGQGQGLGKDWAVFRVNANANTGLRPHQVQGFYRMTYETPAAGATLRVTGYGIDNTPAGTTGRENAQTRTNQTSTGGFAAETISGADVSLTYAVDTMGANSGSPIIWEANGFTIGIHTNAGCTASGGNNSGTGFGVLALQVAIQNFPGPNQWYVDKVTISPLRTGFVMEPFTTIAAGIAAAGSGHTVSIVAGKYNEPMTIKKNITLAAPSGTVVIGAP